MLDVGWIVTVQKDELFIVPTRVIFAPTFPPIPSLFQQSVNRVEGITLNWQNEY